MELDEIGEIERLYTEGAEEPSLGGAYAALLSRFDNDQADRETCLRLLFLAWYACSEPGFLTGLPEEQATSDVFGRVFDRLDGEDTDDPEVLGVVGLMASNFPYCCGDEGHWATVGARLRQRYRSLPPAHRFGPDHFKGRGAYGRYMAQMAPYLAEGS